MREILLCTLGTRGDFQPFLAIGALLQSSGHEVTLLSNSNWRAEARSAGLRFVAIAEEDEPQNGRDDHAFFLSNTLPSFTHSRLYVETRLRQGRRPALVYRSNMLGMQCAAEKYGLTNAKVVLQPSAIRSYQSPPWPLSKLTSGAFGWVGRNIVVPTVYTLGDLASPYRSHTNRFRKHSGVGNSSIFRRSSTPEQMTLVLAPSWFAIPQQDWPANHYLTGFPTPKPREVDREVLDFIASHGPPLVFTPGTGVANSKSFFDRAAQTVVASGMPAIFLGKDAPPPPSVNGQIISRGYLDLGGLLPKAAALFHHGGIGSTAEAIRAGIPQIVIPGRFDQPDNAMRVARLGLGAAIFSDKVSGVEWANLLLKVFRNDHVATQLATAKHLLLGEDGIGNACTLIEKLISYPLGDAVAA